MDSSLIQSLLTKKDYSNTFGKEMEFPAYQQMREKNAQG